MDEIEIFVLKTFLSILTSIIFYSSERCNAIVPLPQRYNLQQQPKELLLLPQDLSSVFPQVAFNRHFSLSELRSLFRKRVTAIFAFSIWGKSLLSEELTSSACWGDAAMVLRQVTICAFVDAGLETSSLVFSRSERRKGITFALSPWSTREEADNPDPENRL